MADLVKIANARDHAMSGAGRLVRLSSGISLREMARTIEVDASTLLRWERGERRPTGAAAGRWVDELTQLAERDRPRRRPTAEMREAGFPASEPLADENVDANGT